LKYETLETKRTVYAGGGIMPDIFVPLDTTDLTDYYRSISRNGHINNFTFQFVNSNRERLMKEYPTFDSFKTNFTVTESFSQDFLAYIAQQDSALIFNQEEFHTSKKLIDLRIKAIIAQDLWGTAEFYELFNQSNEIVQRAVLALQNEETKVLKKTNKKRK
jgi:carboxyl-terminal processing protease